MEELKAKGKRILPWVLAGMGGIAALCCSQVVCLPAWLMDGITVRQCPSGDVRQVLSLEANSLKRGALGWVSVYANAQYTTGRADEQHTAAIRYVRADLFLVDEKGAETALEPPDGWDGGRGYRSASVLLPDVPDGHYVLRAKVRTSVGEGTVDAELPLFARAKVHVLTDRPLYEPGTDVLFRAVALKATDLTPLADRPGVWTVRDSEGTALLEEKARTDAWGVVSGSFPIDAFTEPGIWTVEWSSAGSSGSAAYQVEPFTLPRFKIEATSAKGHWEKGEIPVLNGTITYSSGAPVARAEVNLSWEVRGDWPAPNAWSGDGPGSLPQVTSTDAYGRFQLTLPEVPRDLQGKVRVVAQISATDEAGDRATGSVTALLAQDAIDVSAVTELGDGLVEGFNNRLYVRVTTPTGSPLRATALRVKRAWDPTDKGVLTDTDEDGVAALQIDPGPPVNVLIPPQPVRPPPRVDPIQRGNGTDLVTGRPLTLADQLALDRLEERLEPCARFVASVMNSLTLGMAVDTDGTVRQVSPEDAGLSRCLADQLRGARLGAGSERLLSVNYVVQAPTRPTLSVLSTSADGQSPVVDTLIEDLTLDARRCLSDEAPDTTLPAVLTWRVTEGSQVVQTRWISTGRGSALDRSEVSCLEGALAQLVLPEPAETTLMGATTVDVIAARRPGEVQPQPTTLLGYELSVVALASADDDAIPLGETRLRLSPGTVPRVRLRAEPVLAEAGQDVEISILRGPDFEGELPEKLYLSRHDQKPLEAPVDEETRTATFSIPAGVYGWYTAEWSGARALVYVAPEGELELSLTADALVHRPGDEATIEVRTTAGGKGVPAAVGLFGVDDSLSQLAELPGPGELDQLRPQVTTTSPAFDALDGQALAMGRVVGANAAAAVVLRVSQVPGAPEIDPFVSASGRTAFDPNTDLVDHFYLVLEALHAVTRAWEKAAPEGEKMKPETMAGLWEDAVDAVEGEGKSPTDAYGRRLELGWLPEDLLALTAPHAVVVDGTRLNEDVENWSAWVRKEQP